MQSMRPAQKIIAEVHTKTSLPYQKEEAADSRLEPSDGEICSKVQAAWDTVNTTKDLQSSNHTTEDTKDCRYQHVCKKE
jgi:hypothetical protein